MKLQDNSEVTTMKSSTFPAQMNFQINIQISTCENFSQVLNNYLNTYKYKQQKIKVRVCVYVH